MKLAEIITFYFYFQVFKTFDIFYSNLMNKPTKNKKYKQLLNSAIKHQQTGNIAEARASYQKLLINNDRDSKILYLLGSLYGQSGDFNLAIKTLLECLKIDSENFNAYTNLSLAYEFNNNLKQAIRTCLKSLTLKKHTEIIHSNLGDLYFKQQNYTTALKHLNLSLQINPLLESALIYKANVLTQLKQYKEARSLYTIAIKHYPENVSLLSNYSAMLQLEDDQELAKEIVERALTINPEYAQALSNMGNILIKKKEFEKAEQYLLKALSNNSGIAEVYINLGFICHNTARLQQALQYFNKAVQLAPINPMAYWYRSFTLLLLGRFDIAWQDYAYGLKNGERQITQFDYPAFSPEQMSNNRNTTLLITAEQGIGDQIMFASCLNDLTQLAISIIYECDKRLIPLFSRSFPGVTFIQQQIYDNKNIKTEFLAINCQISSGSLPQLFRRKLSDFPVIQRYIVTDDNRIDRWKKRYAALGSGLKIGISWQGGTTIDHQKRSMCLNDWVEILSCNCQFINLQYGDHSEEIEKLKNQHNIDIHDWSDSNSLRELDDFSAKIQALDLVIAVGNANVHLAGSVGIKTWCLIPHVPSWRWLYNGTSCLWYTSVSIVRQKNINDWNDVLEKIKIDLQQLIKDEKTS